MINCRHCGPEFRITLIRGKQRVSCASCGKTTIVEITFDDEGSCSIDTWS